jgi:hypothetical protein
MANTIRIKRRANGGSAGAPAVLKTSEIAYNETDDTLYIGYGDDGGGNATSIRSFAGFGAAVGLSGNQTIGGIKTFSSSPIAPTPSGGDNSTKLATTAFVQNAVTGGSVADGDKGDITVSGSGATWTIDAGAVSNSKLANMTTKTYKGRTAGTTGAPEDIPLATLQSDLGLALKADLASPTFTGTPAAPTAIAGTNTTQIATTAYVVAEIAARFAANDAMQYKGAIDCSANPNYPAASAGDTYRIAVAGKIGGASGPNVEAGDMVICFVDSSAAGNHATVGGNWNIIQVNIDGAVTITGTQTLTNKTLTSPTINGGTIDSVTIDGGSF